MSQKRVAYGTGNGYFKEAGARHPSGPAGPERVAELQPVPVLRKPEADIQITVAHHELPADLIVLILQDIGRENVARRRIVRARYGLLPSLGSTVRHPGKPFLKSQGPRWSRKPMSETMLGL